MKRISLATVRLAILTMPLFAAPGSASSGRGLGIEDILRMEDIGRTLLTPGREQLLFEKRGPYAQAPNLDSLALSANFGALAHIYIHRAGQKESPQPLFEQRADTGYWLGALSPNGSAVTIFALSAGVLRAGVVDLRKRRVRYLKLAPLYSKQVEVPVWISEREIMFVARASDFGAKVYGKRDVIDRANVLWKRSITSREPSATVQYSVTDGIVTGEAAESDRLVRVDIVRGTEIAVADGRFFNLRLSASGRFLAGLMEKGLIQPDASQASARAGVTHRQLAVIDLNDNKLLMPCASCNVWAGTVYWSSSQDRLSLLSRPAGQGIEAVRLQIYSPGTGEFRDAHLEELLLVCARPQIIPFLSGYLAWARPRPVAHADSDLCKQTGRNDWYFINNQGRPTSLTRSFGQVSSSLVGITSEHAFLLADGEVWQVDAHLQRSAIRLDGKGAWRQIGIRHRGGVYSPELFYTNQPPPTSLVVLENDDDVRALDLATVQSRLYRKPTRDAATLAVSGSGLMAVFRTVDLGSTRLFVSPYAQRPYPLLTINAHLREVSPAQTTTLSYRHPNGIELSSCILLPPGARDGQRFPTVVNVYPDSDGSCRDVDLDRFDPYHFQVLTSAGFAILYPSVPATVVRTDEGPTRGLTRAVLAAVDSAIERGYVDPNRLAIYGFSQGYHNALEVIGETSRFRAAVVSHGVSNRISHYGTVPFAYNLMDNRPAAANSSRYEAMNTSEGLGTTPWQDPQRYVRNSALFSAGHIETPLLILHSDFDMFPLGQSEEIFSALYRQRKPASLVTYWGEGHGLASPANIRDMWNRIHRWLDTYLK